ncbi:hypothetical protein PJL18_03917 [Paenarthrobacter nicotinovorans]|nr:hypothetical protein [Paenarthrobacter nicotinovorans]
MPPAWLFAKETRGEQHRKQHLRLQYQGRQACRHPQRHAEVQQTELPGTHEESDADNRLPADVRFPDEEDERKDHQEEAHGHEEQRRDVPAVRVESEVDCDEVDAPEDGDKHGKEGVAKVHKYTLTPFSLKHQR